MISAALLECWLRSAARRKVSREWKKPWLIECSDLQGLQGLLKPIATSDLVIRILLMKRPSRMVHLIGGSNVLSAIAFK
jgi:hypothetical protein